jgi:hypothetical protein
MITKRANLSLDTLRKFLSYDPATGIFTRRVGTSWNAPAGSVAGCVRGDGYVLINVMNESFFGHHLAWLYMTGEWPTLFVDHRNTITSDNRWENLREASRTQNAANSGLPRHNTSGVKGVCWDRRRRKWMAKIKINQRCINIGRFESIEAATAAYTAKAKELFGDFVRSA